MRQNTQRTCIGSASLVECAMTSFPQTSPSTVGATNGALPTDPVSTAQKRRAIDLYMHDDVFGQIHAAITHGDFRRAAWRPAVRSEFADSTFAMATALPLSKEP
jgi:hypothetical protein